MKHVVIDNFFDDFKNIENHFKKIKLYPLSEYKKKIDQEANWPGHRSDLLHKTEPFLFALYNKQFKEKFNMIQGSYKVDSVIHLRENNKNEFVHRDNNYNREYTCLVYLSKSNPDSGTYLLSEDNQIITDVKFVQNRAFLFDSRYLHTAYGNHKGRLTLNCFYKKV
jgi:hypothetical protein